ncbi:TetR/AcrR family transcriptional regulator [Paraburkholderia xenovorans]|uniref:TetR/AcrR family transcriptional regulator n=1 Tax=Paraburkholderia xenovorans TaxID=36873 RepID=UPI0015584416|nr:TetR/AcrR family transcriptional regulator [Paraburkholderia xenovorans]NPT38251.1 TetR family transcriptional regulator [Paraburkholderia xenovorans]
MTHSSRRSSTRPRKAPSQARAEETVESIIEAAAQVPEAEGLEGFNTNAIARRAGVSIGSLYQYFPGKESLTVALIQRETRRFYDDAAAALTQRSGKAALEYLIGTSVRQQLQRPMLGKLLDVQESSPALRGEVEKVEFDALVVAIVKRVAPRLEHPEVAAADLLAIVQGLTDAAGEREERDLESLEHRVRAAAFGYLSRVVRSGKHSSRADGM